MTTEDFKRKLTAILSADVVGYSRLMGEDEATTVKTLETYKGVMFSLIKQHRGRVVDSPGDNLLAEFGSVVDAVQCAVSIQKELQARNADLPDNRRMAFRIGINLGDVIEEDDRIYGDGVNIAARLEALADPGGICISKTAFDYIENKLPFGYRFIGNQAVKNIAKPIGAYKVLMETRLIDEKEQKAKASFWGRKAVLSLGIILILAIVAVLYWNFYLRGPSSEPASVDRMAYPLPDKPSIAVLPFTNISGDPEQDYIGDGLSENIISALSFSSEIFVIASNSTFTYKGKPVKVQEVAEDLGVQYVLEGGIQKSGDQLRVTAQLIDALSGHQLWSEVYDREMRNLFDLQDEITKKIMVSLQVELGDWGEDLRLYAKSTNNLEAWKHYIKGMELFFNYIEEDNAKARNHVETALELDSQYVSAISQLGWTHLWDFLMGWSDSPSASFNRAFEFAQKAVKLNDKDPFSRGLLGVVSLYQGQYENAIFEGKHAITLNPNYALGYGALAYILVFNGDFDEAITMTEKAYRLNPNLHPVFLINLARSHIFLERYEKALEVCDEMEEQILNGRLVGFKYIPPLYSSWIYQELGREEEARAYMAEALKREREYSLERAKILSPYKNAAHLQRMLDAYRKAGMPEKAPGAVQEKSSIAVLPFDDLSPEKDQEYFVLGLSEEILNSLAQISDLTVIAKTSSFSFKGTNKKIQEIASELRVDHILEGSVRKAGNAIRITAQLIKAVDGSHLWSKTYDRELKVKEIFAVQEDIATAVADELMLTLGIDRSLKQVGGTDNLEAYELYLVAKGHDNAFERDKALESLDAAIALDPEYASAWALKANAHNSLAAFSLSNQSGAQRDLAILAAQKAIELEPRLGAAYYSLGNIKASTGDWIEAELLYRKAMELITESMYENFAFFNLQMGHFKKANELYEVTRQYDPFNQNVRANYIRTFGHLGDYERFDDEYEHANELLKGKWNTLSLMNLWLVGLGDYDSVSRDKMVWSHPIGDIGREHLDSPEEGLAEMRRIYAESKDLSSSENIYVSLWAAYFGDPELAMDAMEKGISIDAGGIFVLWYPAMREVRKTLRFKQFVSEIGLVDYWKEYGWPDLCRPVGDDNFECD